MTNLYDLKRTLEKECHITSWNPSEAQLKEIATRLPSTKDSSRTSIQRLITQVCPGASFIIMDGVDNSDLRTLLAMAQQAINQK